MSYETFVAGDMVQLKSGGPPMMVFYADKSSVGEFAICKWIDRNGMPQKEEYLFVMLQRVP